MFCAVGEVPEWFKGLVLKTSVRASVPWVRIPPSPPTTPTICLRTGYGLLTDRNGVGFLPYSQSGRVDAAFFPHQFSKPGSRFSCGPAVG